jgi:1-aminocyclopropane-1-carboxylate deaminase
MFPDELKIIDPALATLDKLTLPGLTRHRVGADMLRLDKIHPVISGNKWFKLKQHLQIACAGHYRRIITFGGAWSNHIVATAFAAREIGLPVTGIIRGERPGGDAGQPATLSNTLQSAVSYGMQLEFVSRGEYRQRQEPAYLDRLHTAHPDAYIIPEGGAGLPGIQGSAGMADWVELSRYSHVLCAVGTGTMFLGLASVAPPGLSLIGIPVLKGMDNFLAGCREWLPDPEQATRCHIRDHYHFGGYARRSEQLLDFMRRFYHDTGIPTDFVYTGKLCFAALDLVDKGYFPPGSHLLLIHSGGLQGNASLPPGALGF